MKRFALVLILALYACGGGAGASDPTDTPYPFEGIWNWSEIKVSDDHNIGAGHQAEVCMGDVVINHDGTCEMSERCVRDEDQFFPYVYTVDCDWRQAGLNLMVLRMYAPDRSWYQTFVAIANKDTTQATITRLTTHERSYITAYKSDVSIVEALGDITPEN